MKTLNTNPSPWQTASSLPPYVPNRAACPLQAYATAVSRQNILRREPFQQNIVMHITSQTFVSIQDLQLPRNVLSNRLQSSNRCPHGYRMATWPRHSPPFQKHRRHRILKCVLTIVSSLRRQMPRKFYSSNYLKCSSEQQLLPLRRQTNRFPTRINQ